MNQPGLSENIEYLNQRKLILVKLKQKLLKFSSVIKTKTTEEEGKKRELMSDQGPVKQIEDSKL